MDNYRGYLKLVKPCDNVLLRGDFMEKYGLGNMAMAELCDR